ncbi:Na+/H+ antiporter [uncultured Candidatus Thioglobus sp.]|nr:Na+/H+ antiporter [uncultured Candidatus Thioglobus sp.]
MPPSYTVLFLMVLLLLGMLLEPLARRLHVPFSIVLVVIGFIFAEFFVAWLKIDTGIRWDNFGYIIFYIILPIIIFHSALQIDIRLLWKNIVPIGLLSFPLMLISMVIIAVSVFYGIGHPGGFPWIAAFIVGSLLSATEPMAVLPTLQQMHAPKRLKILLEGESLFNDATAVVIFSTLVIMAASTHVLVSVEVIGLRFITVLFGGVLVGVVTGLVTCLLMKIVQGRYVAPLVNIVCAYSSFLIAEDILKFSGSGILSVLSSGLIVGLFSSKLLTEKARDFNNQLWSFLEYISESLIFLLAGITFTLSMFVDRWWAMILAITAVVFARVFMIFSAFPFFNRLPGVNTVPIKQQTVLVWGGVRGTITLALALSLPLSLEYWYTIQSMAYAVVFFTLFVQATTMRTLTHKLYGT